MAIYKRRYTAYDGPLTPTRSRFLILPRTTFPRLFRQRFLMIYMALCLFYPIISIGRIYLAHNPTFVVFLSRIPGLLSINNEFFYSFMSFQGRLAMLLTAFVSPSLISWDMADNALPLYFCRPFSRFEYILGKLSVLLPMLSIITWIPGLFLYGLEGSLSGWTWTVDNFFIARSIFLGFAVWILVLSLIGLALSACVKWRIAAGALFLGVFFGGAGFGAAINSLMSTSYGSLIDLAEVLRRVSAAMLYYDSGSDLPPLAAWICIAIVTGVCILLLRRRIRTFEVIR